MTFATPALVDVHLCFEQIDSVLLGFGCGSGYGKFVLDTEGRDIELRYLRGIDRRQVDFVIIEDGKPLHFVECKKKSGSNISRPLNYLKIRFPSVQTTQVLFKMILI